MLAHYSLHCTDGYGCKSSARITYSRLHANSVMYTQQTVIIMHCTCTLFRVIREIGILGRWVFQNFTVPDAVTTGMVSLRFPAMKSWPDSSAKACGIQGTKRQQNPEMIIVKNAQELSMQQVMQDVVPS